jgi:GxxExxY protein
MLEHEKLTEQIIGAAIEVHRHLGPGLLESAYRKCMVRELELRGLEVQAEVPLPIEYKGISIEPAFRMDLVVNKLVVVELKAVDAFVPVHEAQLLTYLKLSGKKVGLLFNFQSPVLKDGIIRRVL